MRTVKENLKIHEVNLSGVIKKKNACRKVQVGEIVVHLQRGERCWHVLPSFFFFSLLCNIFFDRGRIEDLVMLTAVTLSHPRLHFMLLESEKEFL